MNFNLRTIEWTGMPQRFKAAALGMFNLNDSKWGRGDDKSPEGQDGDKSAPSQRPELDKPVSQQQNDGKKPNGPPDLDELWRDFNQKLTGLLGGAKGKGRPQPNNNQGGNNGGSGGGSSLT